MAIPYSNDFGTQVKTPLYSSLGQSSKDKRRARNWRYRNCSIRGLRNINKAKERHRAKFGSTLISQAAREYGKSTKGRIIRNEAKSTYRRTEHGRIKSNLWTSAHQKTEKGRSNTNKATSSYQKTKTGNKKNKTTSATYREKNNEKISASKKKSYYKGKSTYFSEKLDDFDFERHFDSKRREAAERIRCHFIDPKYRMKFSRNKDQIVASRKSIYLPPLPKLGQRKTSGRKNLFKTRKFIKSRSRLHFKLAGSIILKHNIYICFLPRCTMC